MDKPGCLGHANPTRSNQNQPWTVYNDAGNPDGGLTVNSVADISALVPDSVNIADGFLIDPSRFAALDGLNAQEQADRLAESGVRVDRSGNQTNAIATVGSSTNGIVVYDSGGTAFDGALDGKLFVTQFNDNITLLNNERLLRVREPRCLHVFAPVQPC